MSTQLEFIMQLYMMNLLQQQQQQQQQQTFAPSPVKSKDLLHQQQAQHLQQQQQLHQSQQFSNLRTQKRKLSQNTNTTTTSSSSRSCSPNSNLSPLQPMSATSLNYPCATNTLPTTPFNSLQQQQLLLQQQQQQQQQQQLPLNPLMLNNLPALTQLMLLQHQQQQQQQQQQQITSSNLLLTPTTPNSSSSSAHHHPNPYMTSPQQTSLNLANYLGNNMTVYGAAGAGSNVATPSSTTTPATGSASASSLFFPSAFTAQQLQQQQSSFLASSHQQQQNFLQSSTVTSTPTSSTNNNNNNDDQIISKSDLSSVVGDAFVVEDDDDENNDEVETDIKVIKTETSDEFALTGSVHSSSGNSITPMGNTKFRCSTGLMAFETTTESMEDSTQLPFTPEKSSGQINASFPSKTHHHHQHLITDDENSNVTPMTLKNAILTPPSSEQLSSKPSSAFDSSSSVTPNMPMSGVSTVPGATTGTSCTSLSSGTGTATDSFLTEENLKHLRKNSSYLECENPLCRQENLREHFHCYEEPCQGKILSKKDDIIRHLKWHKKRKESLLLGFARFSSSDDCAPEYGAGCAYNWKQTHYHCVYDECPKVYVSTSDVQMHANFHRKNSEIVQEGFRRFRAHENCKIEECPFYGKKTSHYHCCREGCNHTFKNKADMEKHKVYHLKDHQLTQDGFKKILKTEKCPFDDCKYSGVSNHIHCVRENCNYILHSSTQMISHKRKHDRAEGEQNYQQFKSHRDSSEEESPTALATKKTRSSSASTTTTSTSTPLSSLSAEHFLARKRGRPPKKIQLPSESSDSKRIKLEASSDSNTSTTAATSNQQPNPNLSVLNPFMGNFNPATTAVDPNAPNFQLTHLMALFQLQNPLFYQNLYPRGITAANMANILGAASAQQTTNQHQGNSPNPMATNAGNNSVKQEFSDKQEFKE